MPLKILVEEEYGYKYWLWTVNKPFESVYSRMKNSINENFYSGNPGLPAQFNFGQWKQIEWEEYRRYTIGDKRKEAGAYAHLHMEDDSWIEQADNVEWSTSGRFDNGKESD